MTSEELLSSCRISRLLSESEKQAFENSYMEHEIEASRYQCKAFYTIKAPHRKKLTFQAYIGDTGEGSDLMTPYDERDGKFSDFSDCYIVEDHRGLKT
jgi:hypothetical protein